MKELLRRLFWKKPDDSLESSATQRSQSLSNPFSTEINPKSDFQIRIDGLRNDAYVRHQKGGDAQLRQTMMELVAIAMAMKREDYELKRIYIADRIGLSKQDYDLAEAGILEPDRLFKALPSWLELFSYNEVNFMEDLVAKSKLAILYRKNEPPSTDS
jgi:hypothetical protein